MDIEKLLSQKIGKPQIAAIVRRICGNRDALLHIRSLAFCDDRKTSVNALWVMSHLPESEWDSSLRNDLADMLPEETDSAKKRLILTILRRMNYDADDIRTDLLDFCMSKINAESEPYAIRCFSLYTAYKMCRHYPELLAELERHLDLMALQPLSPGLRSALRQTKKRIGQDTQNIIGTIKK